MAASDVLFASRAFRWAAIYGVLALAPLYLLPLPRTAAEEHLGFIGIALAFQWVFWIIGGQPQRYRSLMLPSVAEKLVFAVPALVLVAEHRAPQAIAGFAVIDLALAVAFFAAWRRVRPS